LTKPISPESAIGSVSRMDAINNKSINESALRQSEEKFSKECWKKPEVKILGFV